ncbi:WD40-repeat-containing domain protein [Ilyonectria robusta]|uniref:WD40-repeat-containing domain protein n=1 Tax=Ilyonectria robusta TaxID=1079257 RepID=UPI001E8E7001|nr:WD40-repeat-containing domain protein [Ilyonectria robusta]KAH8654671.1 WD40-repeat-containing domain protein [Ilyonectria robusta]
MPVRLLHLSFRDFLVDPKKGKEQERYPFWIDERETHGRLAARCLHLLSTGDTLRRDICNLRLPGTARSEIGQQTIHDALPPEVQYACRYWVYHWKESNCTIRDGNLVDRFLTCHLLHWLEALGLLGRISESVGMVDDLLRLLDPEESSNVSAFLRDTRRIILSHRSIIDISPLQIYYSSIVFAPEQSVVRKTFRNQFPAWLSLLPQVDSDWDACLQTLEGHGGNVSSVAFSHDSKLVASASHDTVKLWDVATGACTATFEEHGGNVHSVAFSHDSKLLASVSAGDAKLWDVATGACTATFEKHGFSVSAFSHDSKLLASTSDNSFVASASHDRAVKSDNGTVKLWDVTTGACTATLEGHSGSVHSVTFSHDSKLVASASDDRTVKLWDVATGACTATFEGHSHWVSSVAFSHDSKLVALASYDNIVKLWDVATGACTATFEGHSSTVNSVAFSHDSKLVTSASDTFTSDNGTVQLWDVATGTCTATFEGHSGPVNSVAFSHDSKLVASASYDRAVKSDNGIVKLWDVTTGVCTAILEEHSGRVRSVAFSHDSKLVTSASADRTSSSGMLLQAPARQY